MFKVMIVDDSEINLKTVKNLLEKQLKFPVCFYTFLTGIEAKERFIFIQPDLVITDIYMPEFNGFELIDYIKELSKTPILALSSGIFDCGNGRGGERGSAESALEQAKEKGADYTLSKSDMANALIPMVNDIYQQSLVLS
ncbi:response regulator [Thalassomonas haliotis]|uniref:Response regulator n=1 Tax=Thalassomonas haliotis TaxID=485448 RepID=A0ABY7VLT7_9GAMM|nr:response regulator [Thalassomonas haliotis]WDE13991.1 response regulator [Thalassomonas haliotis]